MRQPYPPCFRSRSDGGWAIGFPVTCGLVLGTLLVFGCARSTTTTTSVLFEDPAISNGAFIEEDDPVRLNEIAEALDAITIKASTATDGTAPPDAIEAAALSEIDDPEQLSLTAAAGMIGGQAIPPESAQLIALAKMNHLEIGELIDLLVLRMGADFGYVEAGPLADSLPRAPKGISMDRVLSRRVEGRTHVVMLGSRVYVSQLPRLWVFGIVIDGDNPLAVNPDTDGLGDMVTQALASLASNRSGVTVQDLETRLIQLSYTDATTAVTMLKALGVTAFDDPSQVPATIDYDHLPHVVAIPDPEDAAVGLIGAAQMGGGGSFGLSLSPNAATELASNTIASPMTQLLVMFHPAQPEQFSRVRNLLDDHIDRPARQIFVEGMVLEISESGLEDLGIEWELDGSSVLITGGTLAAGGISDTLGINFDDFLNPDFDWMGSLKLRALIQEGKARVLSRPSILTLNNRQATIRVGTDIPILTSQEGLSGSANKLVFQFSYLPTGILLNIRPRINEDGTEVSMLIDTIVSDTVRGADLEVRSSDGEVLATAPTISQRRVQTYARIRNNTPFIIGGLVSREHSEITDKIPLLADLPLIGGLFQSHRTESTKREVIIVLTPYVLPETRGMLRSLPKDEAQFDNFGNELFRDSYRIRQEDVFDLEFLDKNRRLTRYRELAREVIRRNFRLAQTPPFNEFAHDRLPGEAALVTRMVYEVVKRQDLADPIEVPRIIYMEGAQSGGFNVRFLEDTMTRLAEGSDSRRFFDRIRGKALALTYTLDRHSLQTGRLATEPIPALSLIDCPDRETWERLMWEMNQPTEDGRIRHTVLIHSEADLLRLRRALVLKRVLALNGGEEEMRLSNFNVGTILLMPNVSDTQVHLVDADVARLFFATEHYYAVIIKRLEQSLNALDAALRDPALGMPDLKKQLEAGAEEELMPPPE